MRKLTILVLSVTLLVGSFSSSGAADTARFTDPNDTPGKLDVRAAGQDHDGGRLVHSVSTFRRWRPRALRSDETYIGFYLDAGSDDSSADRFIWVRWKKGRGLYAQIFRPLTHANGDLLGPVRVSRPNPRSVVISVRLAQLSKGIRNGYRWRVTTSYEKTTSEGPCGNDNAGSSFPTGACVDNAPQLGQAGFRHDI